MGRRVLQTTGALIVTGLVVATLLNISEPEKLLGELADADLEPLLAALPLLLLVFLLRGWRLASALGQPFGFTLFKITVYHNFTASFVPFRLGEVAFPVLLRRANIERVSAAFAILIIIRIIELIIVLIAGGTSIAFATITDPAYQWLPWLGLGLATGSFVALILAMPIGRLGANIVGRFKWVQTTRFASSIAGFTETFRTFDIGRFCIVVLQTAAINILIFGYFYLCANAFHAEHDFAGIVFAATAGAIAFVLPINGLAGYGPFEAAWVFALHLQSVPFESALVSGFVAHTISMLILVAVSLGTLIVGRSTKSTQQTIAQ